MQQYLNLLQEVLEHGERREDRTGTGTCSLFSPPPMKFDLSAGFPLVTTKRVFFRGVVAELLWMLRGNTNIKELTDQGVHIWDEWADQDGDLGPVYGAQWRDWNGIDQIQELVYSLKNNPHSRRHIVNAWNVGEIDRMALPPCHCFFQCYVHTDGRLDLTLYQRSADLFLGVPFNIASYSLLCMMLASVTGLRPGVFTHVMGDAHIYLNHIEQVNTQISRTPYELPTLTLSPDIKSIFDFKAEDITLSGYRHHGAIKADVSV